MGLRMHYACKSGSMLYVRKYYFINLQRDILYGYFFVFWLINKVGIWAMKYLQFKVKT